MSLMRRRLSCCNGEDRVSDQAGVKKELIDGIHKIEMTQIMHSHVLSELSAVVVSS